MQPGFAPPPPLQRFFRKAMLGKAAQMLVQLQVGALPHSPCSSRSDSTCMHEASLCVMPKASQVARRLCQAPMERGL